MKKSINIDKAFDSFDEAWSPKVIGEINNYQIKLAWFENDFVWHCHEDTDEAFLVIEGNITIHIEGEESVNLNSGELFVVPKGIKHKPVAKMKSKVLLFEPNSVINTGSLKNKLTAEKNIWVSDAL